MSRSRFPGSGVACAALAVLVAALAWFTTRSLGTSSPSLASSHDDREASLLREAGSSATEAVTPVPEPSAPSRTEVAPDAHEPAIVVEVVDETLHPIAEPRARLWDEDVVRVGDARGRLTFEDGGARGIVAAEGFRPRSFLVPFEGSTVTLQRDHGVELRVVWAGEGTPVVGARVSPAGDYMRAKLDVAGELLDAPAPTDEQGRTRVRGLAIDSDFARLRIDHPEAPTTWVECDDLRDRPDEPALLEVELPRPGGCPCVRVLDADGHPLAARRVRFTYVDDIEARTDPEGRVSVPLTVLRKEPTYPARVGISVELGSGRGWWWEGFFELGELSDERVVRVEHVQVHGVVRTDTPEAWEVASSTARHAEGDFRWSFWPLPDDLDWSSLDGAGEFRIENGWQGASTVVLLRNRWSTLPIAYARVARDGAPVVLEPPRSCRVVVEAHDLERTGGQVFSLMFVRQFDDPIAGMRAHGGFQRILRLHESQDLHVPVGTYKVLLGFGNSSTRLDDLDALGAEARYEIRVPSLRRVRGTLRSTLVGPIANGILHFVSGVSAADGFVVVDARGAFELLLPAGVQAALTPAPLALPATLTSQAPLRWTIPLDVDELDLVVHEGELTLVERPWNPLLAETAFHLHRRTPDGVERAPSHRISLREADRESIRLPPGDYVVRRGSDRLAHEDQPVRIVDGERSVLEFDSGDAAAVALDVTRRDGSPFLFHVRITDHSGAQVFDQNLGAGRDGRLQFRLPVPSAVYDVLVEALDPGDDGHDVADSWSSRVDVRPGGREAVQVELR